MSDNNPSSNIQPPPEEKRPFPEIVVAHDKPSTSEAQPVTDEQVDKDVKALEKRVGKAEKWMIGLTAALVTVGLCQFGAAFLQWCTMDKQLAEMHDGGITAKEQETENRVEQRAFVTFYGADLGSVFSKSKDMPDLTTPVGGQELILDFTNGGETVARNVTIRRGWGTFRGAVPKDYNFPLRPGIEKTIIAAKATYRGARLSIPIEDLNSVWHGGRHLYVWGTVNYRDIFPIDPPHVTEFCTEIWQLTPFNTGSLPIKSLSDPGVFGLRSFALSPCPQHNCSDEDCEDGGKTAN